MVYIHRNCKHYYTPRQHQLPNRHGGKRQPVCMVHPLWSGHCGRTPDLLRESVQIQRQSSAEGVLVAIINETQYL